MYPDEAPPGRNSAMLSITVGGLGDVSRKIAN